MKNRSESMDSLKFTKLGLKFSHIVEKLHDSTKIGPCEQSQSAQTPVSAFWKL